MAREDAQGEKASASIELALGEGFWRELRITPVNALPDRFDLGVWEAQGPGFGAPAR